ncbi:unnamed protein product [Protopolystoma xenopodis]|uniref:Uncharacterized protein n=1 Tax=Protopolystoma xenopodis TaxID=117903 RepID=A0A3S5CM60_9PLAT|nr:unnamed protein product [Protopolystoma xenopodis]
MRQLGMIMYDDDTNTRLGSACLRGLVFTDGINFEDGKILNLSTAMLQSAGTVADARKFIDKNTTRTNQITLTLTLLVPFM